LNEYCATSGGNVKNAASAARLEPVATGGRDRVSKAMLGQIERNESSPTVATLWKIATGLNVPFSAFIVADEAAPTFDPQQQAMVVTPLFPWDPELRFDHFSITRPGRAE
jgi:transcriptional regulator with XRE-family HTH domain